MCADCWRAAGPHARRGPQPASDVKLISYIFLHFMVDNYK